MSDTLFGHLEPGKTGAAQRRGMSGLGRGEQGARTAAPGLMRRDYGPNGKRVFPKLHTLDSISDAPFPKVKQYTQFLKTGSQSWHPDQTLAGFSLNMLPILV